jgi:hypothetical protein
MSDRPTIFVSYSHEDEDWKDLVVGHLQVAERQGVFSVWDDRRIGGGGAWREEIDRALEDAEIGVLLISRHFLNSSFIMDHEVRVLLERRKQEGLRLYPILVNDCPWRSVDWLADLNIRPTDGQPLAGFDKATQDSLVTDMVEEISRLLHGEDEVRGAPPRRSTSPARPSLFDQWRSAGLGTRATVIGTVFAGLALLWGFFGPSGDCVVDATGSNVACGDQTIGASE